MIVLYLKTFLFLLMDYLFIYFLKSKSVFIFALAFVPNILDSAGFITSVLFISCRIRLKFFSLSC